MFPKNTASALGKIIFPGELKIFRYEEATNLNFIGKRKFYQFEKSDIVSFSEN